MPIVARRAASRLVSAGRALITGISGQDGSYLAELLLEQGYEVVGMARRPGRIDEEPGALAGVRDRIRVVQGDLLDPSTLYRAVAEVQPTELYHLAAPTFVPASWGDPTETVQAIAGGTAALLAGSLALGDGAPRVWVATSSEIFGDAGESPQHERSPMRPRTPYGVAKLAAHGLVGAMRTGQGLFACSGITYNHESPRRPERFLPRKVTSGVAAISLGLQDELVLGDLGAVRDWTHAADIVHGAWLALQADEPGDVVLASGVPRTVGELVAVAFAHVGLDSERHVRVDPSLVRDPEPTAPVGDPSRARAVLGWQPTHSFEEMIAEMVDADLARLRRERSLD
jgi:GDPmannose 4,6-dehydratase